MNDEVLYPSIPNYNEGLSKHKARMLGNYEHLIAVLGVTGAGKSTFIARATGQKVKIGHSAQSCTSEVEIFPLNIKNKRIALIDTPGFDDTHRTDAQVLEEVAKYLAELLAQGILLSGVILLQPVNVTRVHGSERKRTRLFEKICGQDAFPNVVIASTMWSKVKRSDKKQTAALMQERSESTDFWGYMLKHGARYVEHHDSKSSAIKIIEMILTNIPQPLQLQTEIFANNGRTGNTTAGKYVVDCMDDALVKLINTVNNLKGQLSMPGVNQKQIQDELDETQGEIKDIYLAKKKIQQSRITFTKTAAWLNVGTGVLAIGVAVAAPFFCSVM